MLHAFLDGELDGTHEEVLFEKLASQEGLRAEMQDSLAVRKAIQHDTEAFTPPAAATSAVFAALGFSMPPVSTAQAATAGGSAARRLWVSGGSAVVAVTAALLLYFLFPQPAQQTTERVVTTPAGTLAIAEIPALSDLPVSAPAAKRTVTAVPLQLNPAPLVLTDEAIDEVQLDMRPIASIDEHGLEAPKTRYISGRQVYLRDVVPVPQGWTVQLRNVALRANPAPMTISQSEPWFRNLNVGLMYALAENHAIGIEGGQEAFPQNFNGIEDGGAVRYEQNPLAYWATAVYQFNGDALLPHVHPFVQLQVGGAFRLGGLGRATAGLKFKPFDRIAIVLGAEGSLLVYKFQDTWFQTDKLGLTYGLAYDF